MNRLVVRLALVLLHCLTLCASTVRAETITMRSGMQYEGAAIEISGIAENPLKPKTAEEAVAVKKIVLIDDSLRRIFVPQRQIAAVAPSETGARERIIVVANFLSELRRLNGEP